MRTIAEHFDGLMVRNGMKYQGLTIFPVCLVSAEFEKSEAELITLDRGIKTGKIDAFETGEIDAVRLVGRGPDNVFVLDGETLVGGAQNRMLNAGAVIVGREEEVLPACCVEVNRWDCPKDKNAAIPEDKSGFKGVDIAFGSLKKLKMKESISSLMKDRTAKTDQQKIWKHIAENFGISGARTKTMDMHDLYEFWDAPLRVYSTRFTVARNQVGMISFLDRKNWYADIFLNRDLMFKYFKNLVRAYSFDALIRLEKETVARGKHPSIEDARSVFRGLKLGRLHEFGEKGGKYFFDTSRFCGSVVLHGADMVSLTACSK